MFASYCLVMVNVRCLTTHHFASTQVAMELVSYVAAVADCVLRAQLPGAFPSAATEALRVIQRAVTLCSRDIERSAQLLRKTSVALQVRPKADW